MPTSHRDLDLTRSQERILIQLYHGKRISRAEIEKEKYEFLRYYSLLTYVNDKPPYYRLNCKGKSHVIYKRHEQFRYWIPIILSSALSFSALIVSIVALLS